MARTVERTDTSALLHYGNAVVPWVTRWTGEYPSEEDRRIELSLDPDGGLWVFQGAEGSGEEREASGILWQREGIARGGKPEFSQVSTYRQRAAMRKRLCQVCGKKIQTPVVNWLMAEGQLEATDRGEAITMNPPTCDGCIPVARELCPHLYAQGSTVVKVLEYELFGVYAESIRLRPSETPGGQPMVSHMPGAVIRYDDIPASLSPTAIVAKQQVVKFTKFRAVE